MTGVDLAPRMLEKAHERGLYSRLVQADALDFLSSNGRLYDLVACLDTLIYFGDLTEVLGLVAERLSPGGIFAFSHETATSGDFGLYPTGRFKHSPAYISKLTSQFRDVYTLDTILRLDDNKPVAGRVVLVERI